MAIQECAKSMPIEYKGSAIDTIEFEGAEKRPQRIRILFANGDLLTIKPELDISESFIRSILSVSKGHWGRINR
jgi:hypothetical protein